MSVKISVFRCMLGFATNTIKFVFNIKKGWKHRALQRYILQLSKDQHVTYREFAKLAGLINLITQP